MFLLFRCSQFTDSCLQCKNRNFHTQIFQKLQMFKCEWVSSHDSLNLIKQTLTQCSAKQKQLYSEQMGKILEEFLITCKINSYSIFRSHQEINQLLNHCRSKHQLDIRLGEFMLRGIYELQKHTEIQKCNDCSRFFELYDTELQKVKSIKMLKNGGGRYYGECCLCRCFNWNQKNFVITEEGLLYYNVINRDPIDILNESMDMLVGQDHKVIKEYMPFNNSFKLRYHTPNLKQFQILILSNHRKLLIEAKTVQDFIYFVYFLKSAMKKSIKNSKARFHSFAPFRLFNKVEFFVDGADYFRNVAQALEQAEEEILICGWWVSPEFHLVRPVDSNNKYRLDKLLAKAAKRNVKIFIIVYFESSFLTNDSEYTKKALEKLHQNIKVIRHPLTILPTFWSHHEKLVITDQSTAFLGGLDLCYGRWDDNSHNITDTRKNMYPGIEYNNVRIKDFSQVRNFKQENIPKSKPRLPWHDVTVKVLGEAVRDLSHHFIQYWNYANCQLHYEMRSTLVHKKNKPENKESLKKIFQYAIDLKNRIFTSDAKEVKKKNVKSQEAEIVASSQHANDQKDESYRKSCEKQICETTNKSKVQNANKSQISMACKASESNYDSKSNKREKQFQINDIDLILEEENEVLSDVDYIHEKLPKMKRREAAKRFSVDENYVSSSAKSIRQSQDDECQVLRSVSNWSIGCSPNTREKSIQLAYIHLIQNSQKFIYIENQFFISKSKNCTIVKNQVVEALYERIKRAISEKAKFKVYVFMPLIPGFEGELDDEDAVLPRIIMHWQYKTMSRGQGSLLERLKKLTKNPENYIKFFSLRTHGLLKGKPMTEIIYIHSKLMIVDDSQAILGSANINDRSMNGSRDSEVCILVQNGQALNIQFDSKPFLAQKKVHQLRVKLCAEHFGLAEKDVSDVLEDSVDKRLSAMAKRNTQHYRSSFGCYPDDSIKKLSEIDGFKKQISQEEYCEIKEQIQGNVVQFPLRFLEEEDLLEGSSLYPHTIST